MDYKHPLRLALRDWYVGAIADANGKPLPLKDIERLCRIHRTDHYRIMEANGDTSGALVARIAAGLKVPPPAFHVAQAEADRATLPRVLIRRAVAALQEADTALEAADATPEPAELRDAVSGALEAIARPPGQGKAARGKGRRQGSG